MVGGSKAVSVRALICLGLIALVTATPSTRLAANGEGDEFEPEVIDLTPDGAPNWGLRNVFAPVMSIFVGGPSYYYKPRRIEVDTTPSGGLVDLFYIRSNFQKRFEQAETPVIIMLPPRIEVGKRDVVTIRAFREGFRQKSVTLKATGREKQVVINLEPLPNTLETFAHRYFGGRSSLTFVTSESLTFRMQEASDGFSVILTETAKSSEAESAIDGTRSPLLSEIYAQQLGEDLLVKVGLSERALGEGIEPRTRQAYEAARELYTFTVDLTPVGGGAAVNQALAALAAITPSDVTGCALIFDGTLRDQLNAGALARAMTPSGRFTDRYFRAAMRRLGEVSPGGVVDFTDGSSYRPAVAIELDVSLSLAAAARGYLALLRSFVGQMESAEYTDETLRGLVAPEVTPASFDVILASANEAEQECRGG